MGTAMSECVPGALTDRMPYIVALRDAGHTLGEIGDTLGISGERVRQLLDRAGHVARPRSTSGGVDPIALLRFARSPECRSFADCCRRFGTSLKTVARVLNSLGVAPALLRLYAWRVASDRRARIVAKLQAFAATHGRAPTAREINAKGNGAPFPTELNKAFGSNAAAFRAAGLLSRPRGWQGHAEIHGPRTMCKRGHECTAENTYVYTKADGKQQRICRICALARKREAYRRVSARRSSAISSSTTRDGAA